MSDTMLLGVLRMPIADGTETLILRQFINRARQAADRIEADAERIAALEADRAAALRLANDLTLETQTTEEAVADLVRIVRDARTRIAALEASLAERDRVIEQVRGELEALLRHFTKVPSTLADSKARGRAHDALQTLQIEGIQR